MKADRMSDEAPHAWSNAKSSIEFFVSAATVVYALGYLSWAYYSWEERLDLPPALEGQYVVAGVVPALLLILLWLAIAGLSVAQAKLRRRAKPSDRKWHRALNTAGLVLIVAGFVAKYGAISESVYGTLISIGLLLVLIALFFSTQKTDRLFARGVLWYGIVAAPVLSLALVGIYVTRLFPYLPAEFGGPATSCVKVDLKKSELAETTLNQLVDRIPLGSAPEMIQSRSVEMLSPPGRYYLIAISNSGTRRFVKINTDLVRAIVPAEDCAAPKAGGSR